MYIEYFKPQDDRTDPITEEARLDLLKDAHEMTLEGYAKVVGVDANELEDVKWNKIQQRRIDFWSDESLVDDKLFFYGIRFLSEDRIEILRIRKTQIDEVLSEYDDILFEKYTEDSRLPIFQVP